jgi:hypothetical protein
MQNEPAYTTILFAIPRLVTCEDQLRVKSIFFIIIFHLNVNPSFLSSVNPRV